MGVEDAANTVAKHVSAFGHAEAQLMESSKGSQNDSKRLEKLALKMDKDAQTLDFVKLEKAAKDNAKTAQKESKHTRVRSMATKDMQEQKTALAETTLQQTLRPRLQKISRSIQGGSTPMPPSATACPA